uniref:Uncharacterized protein n=1 Tax=Rangifer tarandus platyrhynchus TaxID=3082113 RepID=A0ACB0E766_RANTA|nr:unnamed protein product [Rangifer tarandus platyrhynchus]
MDVAWPGRFVWEEVHRTPDRLDSAKEDGSVPGAGHSAARGAPLWVSPHPANLLSPEPTGGRHSRSSRHRPQDNGALPALRGTRRNTAPGSCLLTVHGGWKLVSVHAGGSLLVSPEGEPPDSSGGSYSRSCHTDPEKGCLQPRVWECAVGSSTNRHNKSNAAPLSARLVSYGSHSRVFGCRQRSPATPAERPPDEAPTPRGERGATGPGLLTTHTGAPAPPPQSHHTVLQPGHSSGRSSLRTVPTPRLTSLVSAGKLAQLLAKFSPKNVT